MLKLPLRHPYGGCAATLDSRATPGNTVGDGYPPSPRMTAGAYHSGVFPLHYNSTACSLPGEASRVVLATTSSQ